MSRIQLLMKPWFHQNGRLLFKMTEPKLFAIRRNASTRAFNYLQLSNNIPSYLKRNDFYPILSQGRNFHKSIILLSEVIKVPPFADSVTEGDVKFTCKVGDAVKTDDVVMEIETDKTAVPVPAPFDGVIEEIMVSDGDVVKSGQPLFKLKKA